jgi:hypothetical protein
MNLDGSNQTRLTNAPLWRDEEPAFSYDSQRIFFTSYRDANPEIYSMLPDGSDQRRITQNVLDDHAASPGGSGFVAFAANPGNGDTEIYRMTEAGTGFVPLTNNFVNEDNPSWGAFRAPATARFDFERDGKADIGIFRPGSREWWIRSSATGSTSVAQFGAPGDVITPADYTGDGKTDIAVWRPSTGEWFILRSEDFSYYSFPFGTAGDIPAPGDFDTDGKFDPTVFRPSTGVWYVWKSGSAGGVLIRQFGLNGDVPVPGNYDGFTEHDFAIFRPSTGQWWILRSLLGLTVISFGSGTDKPVPGDYTGDGATDVAVWRPSTGEWFVVRSEDFSYYGFPFGTSGDIPAPGDYDGDGLYDPTVFRPNQGLWFSQRTSSATNIQQFGLPGDRPLPNAFVP